MKVLFLYPMWTGEYKGIAGFFARKSGGTYPPLNLALLAAIAEQGGHTVQIIDAEVERINEEDLASLAKEKNADLIAMTAMSPFFHLSLSLARRLRAIGVTTPICLGGQHITIVEEKGMHECFDFGFLGESEASWEMFLKAHENGTGYEEIPGFMYWEDGSVVKNAKVASGKDLDKYPLAARHLLPMHKYFLGTMRGRLNFTTIQFVRGCPWKCIFCASDQLETTKILKRSVASVVDEMEGIVKTYNVRHFVVVDDVLTLSRKRTIEFCEELMRRDLKITFEGSTRANLVDDELMGIMKEAGLIRLSFGLETVDEDMRATMNKQVPLESYREANRLTNKHGVEALNSVMIGLPGETVETVRKTLDFLRTAKDVKQANFAIAIPYPGTEFHRISVNEEKGVKLISSDLSEYRRYGTAVTQINELGPDDLVRLQNEGFVSVYSRYWRWIPVVKKNGILGLVFTFARLFKMLAGNVMRRPMPATRHPSLD